MIRHIFLTTILLMLSLHCGAQHSLYNLDFKLSQKDFADTITIEYEHGQVTLPVSFRGKTYRFLFDTGASQTTLFDDALPEGTRHAGFTVSHDAIASRDTVNTVTLPPMTIGRTTFTGCQATIQRRIRNTRQQFDGIIGFDIVCKGLHVKIDVERRQFILSDRFDFFDKDPDGITVKYKLNYHVPYVEVCPFGKYREKVLFDTGSRQLYMMNKGSFDLGAQKAKTDLSSQIEERLYGRHAIGHSGVEKRGEIVFLSLNHLQIGSFTFRDVHTMTTQGGSHIGAQLLEYGTVSFNPLRHRLRFCPYNSRREAVVGNSQPIHAIVPVNGRAVFGYVRTGSATYKKGFREGDTIIMIDQQPIRSFADYLQFRYIKGQTHTFLVRDAKNSMKELKSLFPTSH